MKKIIIACIVAFFIILSINSFKGFRGTVIDAETKKPIEGADVFARWTDTKGVPGMSNTITYKIDETVTDKNGKFNIFGPLIPKHPPTLVIYKKGYLAWNNEYIFPYWKKRQYYFYGDKIKLDKFTTDYTHYCSQYTHDKHMDFLDSSSLLGIEGDKISKASEWERKLARKERDIKVERNLKWKVIDSETGIPIEGAIGSLYRHNRLDIKVISDKEGNITINGSFPVAYPFSFSIVKEGYWDWKQKTNIQCVEWVDGYIFKLNRKNPRKTIKHK